MRNSLEDLEKLRLSYTSKLGELFHHKNASDLARLSQNPNYQTFVYDYVSLENITSQFREEFLKCKSALRSVPSAFFLIRCRKAIADSPGQSG